MDLKIVKNKENNLLARREVEFSIRHDGATTPSRVQARQLLAGELGTKTENVVIAEMGSVYGMGATFGTARAYKSADAARANERVHFLKRNSLYIEKAKKGEKKADDKKGA